jgi:hypothetical protein
MWFTAMTYEISAGASSAATTAERQLGEKVNLSPVADKRVEAIVRRRKGPYTDLSLPLFQSLIDV